MKKLCSLICALALTALPVVSVAETAGEAPATYDVIYSSSNPVPEIAARVRPAIVQVWGYQESWDAVTRRSSSDIYSGGSGCYIRATDEGGFIVTNNHVVSDCDSFKLVWLDGTEMDAELKGSDDGTDIAVLEFKQPAPEGTETIPLGDSDALQIGELAICIGNPGSGLETWPATVTAGIISGVGRPANSENFSRNMDTIQTDAAINTGNSGGALLNGRGELVGIPTLKMMYNTTTIYEGIGFCIPINTVKDVMDQLISTGNVVRPRMGMMVLAVDGPDEAMRKYTPAGMKVVSVDPLGPADKAGIRENDIITEMNGKRVYSFTDMTAVIDKQKAGDSIELKLYRYSYDETGATTGSYETLTVSVKLEMLD